MDFTIFYPELAFLRFEVWDIDPIGRDFIGQKTMALNSIAEGSSAEFIGQGKCKAFLRCSWGKKVFVNLAKVG